MVQLVSFKSTQTQEHSYARLNADIVQNNWLMSFC